MQLEPGMLFADHYQLIKLLGRGGFSEVWLAEDNWTHLQIAIKVYAPGQGMNPNGLQVFCKEFANVFNLNHTNLLKPTHVDTWHDMPYLIMPYCPEGSLETKLGKMSEQQMWKMIHDVASGLAYLHDKDIVHQDIKPDNILLDKDGNYVITDFGISTQARTTLRKSVIASEGIAGTTAYMGPERFSKEPAPIKASDVWSLGATCFELIEGRAPFGEIGGGMQKGGAEIPTITANVSASLKFVITKMLSKEPWERPVASTLAEWALHPEKIEIPVGNGGKHGGDTQQFGEGGGKMLIPEGPQKTESVTDTLPPRHWFTVLWMVITTLIVGYFCVDAISSTIAYYRYLDFYSDFLPVHPNLCVLFLIGNILSCVFMISIWRNSKAGYFLAIGSTILSSIISGYIYYYHFVLLLPIGALAILALVLCIKRDGISGWERFNIDKRGLWKTNSWITVLLAFALFIIVFSCAQTARNNEKERVRLEEIEKEEARQKLIDDHKTAYERFSEQISNASIENVGALENALTTYNTICRYEEKAEFNGAKVSESCRSLLKDKADAIYTKASERQHDATIGSRTEARMQNIMDKAEKVKNKL